MPAVVDTPQEPSNLKTTLLAPVRWLVICVFAALTIILFLFTLLLALVAIPLDKLYRFAGGKYPEAIEQMIPRINGEIAQAIRNTPQTTHDTDINNAINLNVQVLRDNYGKPDTGDEFIKEIEDFIKDPKKEQFTEDAVKHARQCLERIQNNPDEHSINRLTLKQILNLVWEACNDKSKKTANSGIDIDARILQRKYQLVKHLIDAETEY